MHLTISGMAAQPRSRTWQVVLRPGIRWPFRVQLLPEAAAELRRGARGAHVALLLLLLRRVVLLAARCIGLLRGGVDVAVAVPVVVAPRLAVAPGIVVVGRSPRIVVVARSPCVVVVAGVVVVVAAGLVVLRRRRVVWKRVGGARVGALVHVQVPVGVVGGRVALLDRVAPLLLVPLPLVVLHRRLRGRLRGHLVVLRGGEDAASVGGAAELVGVVRMWFSAGLLLSEVLP
jgi:hypothetical protein